MSDAEQLYRALLLEHGNHPRRVGRLAGATHQARQTNPLCGDRVSLELTVAGERVEALRFEVRGCLISKASASLLGEVVEGRTVAEARALAATLEALARAPSPPAEVGALEPLRGVRGFPARLACVELPWKALLAALEAGAR
jgi:nitrogen fixation protein NifU and related proteins